MKEKLEEKIELLRKNKSWTQGQLALYAEIDRSYVTKLESGDAPNVSGIILARIARALGTSTDYLLGLTDSPSPVPSANHPAFRDPRVQDILDIWRFLTDIGHEPSLDALHKLALAFRTTYEAKRKPPED